MQGKPSFTCDEPKSYWRVVSSKWRITLRFDQRDFWGEEDEEEPEEEGLEGEEEVPAEGGREKRKGKEKRKDTVLKAASGASASSAELSVLWCE